MADCEVTLVGEEPGPVVNGVKAGDKDVTAVRSPGAANGVGGVGSGTSRSHGTPADREGWDAGNTGVIAPDGPLSGELSVGSQGATSDGSSQPNEPVSSPHPQNYPHACDTGQQPNGSRNRSTGSSQKSEVAPDEWVERERLCEEFVHACARFGNVTALQKLLAERPARAGETDLQGQTPLHFCASYGEVDQPPRSAHRCCFVRPGRKPVG